MNNEQIPNDKTDIEKGIEEDKPSCQFP